MTATNAILLANILNIANKATAYAKLAPTIAADPDLAPLIQTALQTLQTNFAALGTTITTATATLNAAAPAPGTVAVAQVKVAGQ